MMGFIGTSAEVQRCIRVMGFVASEPGSDALSASLLESAAENAF